MSRSKIKSSICVMIVALAMLVANSQMAMAAPTTLVCSYIGGASTAEVTIDLNEAGSTATYNVSAYVNGGTPIPATSSGPLPAKFDSKTVTFDYQNQSGSTTAYVHYTIDRLTGLFSIYSSSNAPWDQASPQNRVLEQYNCHVGNAQF